MSGPRPLTGEADARFLKGWETVGEINGPARDRQVEALSRIAPAFSDWIVRSAYGDVLSDPVLDLRSREIATVAALTALGGAPEQLKAHVQGALNVGLSRQEVTAVIVQMAVYAGVPAALNGLKVAQAAFDEADAQA